VTIPAMLAPYTSQLETMTGMPMSQLLALGVGGFEILAGLMIAVNFGARFFSILLIFFVIGATFYFHDFWNQTGADARNNLVQSLKNLSIIGALLIVAGTTRLVPLAKPAYDV